MSKPIAVVYYLHDVFHTNGGRLISMTEMNETLSKILPDYNVLAIPSYLSVDGSCENLRLQVFYDKDFTPIQYQELKQLIENQIK